MLKKTWIIALEGKINKRLIASILIAIVVLSFALPLKTFLRAYSQEFF